MYIMQPSMNVNKDFCYIPDTDIACSIDGSGHASLLEDGFHDGGGYYICYIEDGKLYNAESLTQENFPGIILEETVSVWMDLLEQSILEK